MRKGQDQAPVRVSPMVVGQQMLPHQDGACLRTVRAPIGVEKSRGRLLFISNLNYFCLFIINCIDFYICVCV